MIARIRGRADVPLSPAGKQQLAAEAQRVAQGGGFDLILSSPLYRARQTAKAYLGASPENARMMIMPGLLPQNQGQFEGAPKDEAEGTLREYEDNRRDEPLPGVSPYTGLPGESSNDATKRFLGKGLIPAMQIARENPNLRILALSHSSNIKIARGWDKAGRPEDLSIAPGCMHAEQEHPSGIVRVEDRGFSDYDGGPILPGLYLGRHAGTTFGG